MDLSAISLPHGPVAPLPPVVTATVEEVRSPNRYLLRLQGMLLELEMNLFLAAGDRVTLRVREQSPDRLVLEVAGRPEEGPVGRSAAGRGPGPPDPAAHAAAYLAGHGLEPAGPLVRLLARLAGPPSAPRTEAALLEPLARALEALVSESPRDIPAKAPLVAGPPPGELEAAVREALARSPRLAALDRLIEAVSALEPAEAGAERLAEARRLVGAVTPESLEATIRQLPRLPPEAIQELLRTLLEMERRELAATPDLAQARAARGTVIDASDRLAAVRLVNQLSRLRGDGTTLLELPVRDGEDLRYVPLRIRRERDGRGARDEEAEVYAIVLDADLSNLGPVRSLLNSAGRSLRVRFKAGDRAAREHLEGGAPELLEALRAQGFEPAVAAEVAERPGRESLFEAFAAPGEAQGLHVEA